MSTHSSTSIAYFDLKTGQFWVPWYNMGAGGWFDNVGLAALGSFEFQVGFDIDPDTFTSDDSVALTGINDTDLSSLVMDDPDTTENEATMITLASGNRVMLTGLNTYTLMPPDEVNVTTLASTAELNFDFEPFYSSSDNIYVGDADSAAHFNGGNTTVLSHIEVATGDSIDLTKSGITVTLSAVDGSDPADGWIGIRDLETASEAGRGQVRQVDDGVSSWLEFRDTNTDANWALHDVPAVSVIRVVDGATVEVGSFTTFNMVSIGTRELANDAADTPSTSGDAVPISGPIALHRLMLLDDEYALDENGALHDTVTPTHVAVGGDWNTASSWIDSYGYATVPGEGAIVHIPEGVEINATGVISDDGNGVPQHIFMVRVDGTLTFDGESAGDATDTKMVVDTIFSTSTGTLNIDADGLGAGDNTVGVGTVDIAITPYDIAADVNMDPYYTDGALVEGWDGISDIEDGAGVLGRFNWDPTQLSLGVVAHGATNIQGQEKTEHIELTGLAAGATSFVMHESEIGGWATGDRIIIAGTKYAHVSLESTTEDTEETFGNEDEVVSITVGAADASGNVTVEWTGGLEYDHTIEQFSGTDAPELKLQIANLSRNVVIRSAVATDGAGGDVENANSIDNNVAVNGVDNPTGLDGHLTGGDHDVTERGHFMAMHSDDVDIQNVAFRGLGRTDKTALIDDFESTLGVDTGLNGQTGLNKDGRLNEGAIQSRVDVQTETPDESAYSVINQRGRYSVHLHKTGTDASDDDAGAYLKGNVVEGSVGWGFVQHGSEAILASNTSYDVVGSGFVAETGDEIGVWYDNFSAGNTGYINGIVDVNTANKSNDIARDGTAFWFEGRALAVIDNTASSSASGFVYQPFGIDQVDVNADAFSGYQTYFDALNAEYNLTGADALTARADDEIVSNFVNGGETVLENGFAPIRYFSGNEVSTSNVGLNITTSNEHGARKFNDAWSIIDDFTAWEVSKGYFEQYTSKYIFNDMNIMTHDAALGYAVDLNTASNSNVFYNLNIESLSTTPFGMTGRNGTHIKRFSDQADFNQSESTMLAEGKYTGLPALESQWEGFGDYSQIFNIWDNHFFDVTVNGDILATDQDLANQTQGANDPAELYDDDLLINANNGNDVSGELFEVSAVLPNQTVDGVDIELIQDSLNGGLVGLWREDLADAGGASYNYQLLNSGTGTGDTGDDILLPGTQAWEDATNTVETPLAHLNSEFNQRTSSHNYNVNADDIWSGALLEFDKIDSLGKVRYSYEELIVARAYGPNPELTTVQADHARLVDLNNDGTLDSRVFVGSSVENTTATTDFERWEILNANGDRATSLADLTFSDYDRVTFQTTNERLIMTKERINATLAEDGYYTSAGVEYIPESGGDAVLMKFVILDVPFTDRLTGTAYNTKIVVALDEAWGEDGSIVFTAEMEKAFDPLWQIDPNYEIAATYDHYLRGELVEGSVVAPLPQPSGIVEGTDGNDVIDAAYMDDPQGDMVTDGDETVLAGDGNDVVFGSGGADTLDGGAGTSDKVNYNGSAVGVNINLGTNINTGSQADGDILSNFEVYSLTDHNDTFVGSGADETVLTYTGQDNIQTGGGNDTIYVRDIATPVGGTAGTGTWDDFIDGGDGYDYVSLKGPVSYPAINISDTGTFGNIKSIERIAGHQFEDVFNVTATDAAGNQATLERLQGVQGDDIFNITKTFNIPTSDITLSLSGGTGADTFNIDPTAASADTMHIVIEDFVIDEDILKWLDVNVDLYNLGDITATVNDAGWVELSRAGHGVIELQGIEDIPNMPDDTVSETAGVIDGTAENDVINYTYIDDGGDTPENAYVEHIVYGYGGNDHIALQRTTNSEIYGGDGNDYIAVQYFGGGVAYGGAGDDTINLGIRSSHAFGGDGDDQLIAYADRGASHELTGGAGEDRFTFVGSAVDQYTYQGVVTDFEIGVDTLVVRGQVVDMADLSSTGITAADVGDDLVLTFNEIDTVTLLDTSLMDFPALPQNGQIDGTAGNDVINYTYEDTDGDAPENYYVEHIVYGYGGNDHIALQRTTNSEIYGGDGNDYIAVQYFGGGVAYGGAGDDTINLGIRSSHAFGGDGDDQLIAYADRGASHELTGGAGEDRFTFVGSAVDQYTYQGVVTDFEIGVDTLVVRGQVVDMADLSSTGITAADVGDDLVLTFNEIDTVTLLDVSQNDFLM